MKVVCAWCQKTLSPGEPDDAVSHGICSACAGSLETNRHGSLEQLLNRFELPVIAVDSTVSAVCVNRAAEAMLGREGRLLKGRLVGDVIECVNAALPGGCGRTVHCAGCAIRRMSAATLEDGKPRCSVEVVRSVRGGAAAARTRPTISTRKIGSAVLVIVEDLKALATDAFFAEQVAEI